MTSTQPPARALVRAAVAERIARELFHLDVLDGATEASACFEQITAHERDLYLRRAWGVMRQADVVARNVALHRAAESATKQIVGLTLLGREAVKPVVRVAIEAFEDQLQQIETPNHDQREVAQFEQLQGMPVTRAFTVLEGGK